MLQRLVIVSAVCLISCLALAAQDEAPQKEPNAEETNSAIEHAKEYLKQLRAGKKPIESRLPAVPYVTSVRFGRAFSGTCSTPLLDAKPNTQPAENTIKPPSGSYKMRYATAPAPPCPRD